jgi:hypothetical protein
MWVALRRRSISVPVLAVAAALDYFAWLGWDHDRDVNPDGSSTGPYQAWQVIGLVVVLVCLAWVAGRAGTPWLGSAVLTMTISVCFAIEAATESGSDGLWPIGVLLVLAGTMLGALTVATISGRRRREGDHRSGRRIPEPR